MRFASAASCHVPRRDGGAGGSDVRPRVRRDASLGLRNNDPANCVPSVDGARDRLVMAREAVRAQETRACAARGHTSRRLIGYGVSSDTRSIVSDPDPAVSTRPRLRIALTDAGVDVAEVDYVTDGRRPCRRRGETCKSALGHERHTPRPSRQRGATVHARRLGRARSNLHHCAPARRPSPHDRPDQRDRTVISTTSPYRARRANQGPMWTRSGSVAATPPSCSKAREQRSSLVARLRASAQNAHRASRLARAWRGCRVLQALRRANGSRNPTNSVALRRLSPRSARQNGATASGPANPRRPHGRCAQKNSGRASERRHSRIDPMCRGLR